MKNVHSAINSIFLETVSACKKTYFSEIALLVLSIKSTKSLKTLGK